MFRLLTVEDRSLAEIRAKERVSTNYPSFEFRFMVVDDEAFRWLLNFMRRYTEKFRQRTKNNG